MKTKILTILMTILIIDTKANTTFIHKKLTTRGVFFETMSNVNFYTQDFSIITKFDIADTRQITRTLLECDNKIRELCDEILKSDPTDLCRPFRQEIKWHLQQIKKQTNKINEMYGRQKRSLLDIGGRMSKFVFGTMDAEDSEKIYDNLKTLEDNQVRIMNVQKENIAVLKSNFDTLSIPITQLQDETSEIKEKLNKLVTRTNELIQNTEKRNTISLQTTELMSLMLIQTMHINKMQEEATEIILTLENHKLHPLIITHNKLKDVLKENGIQTNNDFLNQDILKQIMSVEHMEIEGRIIVKITIPIVVNEKYNLYKVHLVPFPTSEGYTTYKTQTEYIAATEDKTKTIELNTEDVEKGIKITKHLDKATILCKQTHPEIINHNTRCLANLLVNPMSTTDPCETIPTRPLNTLVKLSTNNSWLYSVPTPTDMLIDCNHDKKKLRIKGNGILTFLEKCRISTKDYTTTVTGTRRTVQMEHHQPIEEPEEEIIFSNKEISNSEPMSTLDIRSHKKFNRELIDETNKINELKNMANEIKLQKGAPSTIIQNILTPLATTAILIIAIILIKKCKNNRKQQANNTTIQTGRTPDNEPQNIDEGRRTI